MIDPLAEVVTLLQPGARFSKLVLGAGPWRIQPLGCRPAVLLRDPRGRVPHCDRRTRAHRAPLG